MLGVTQLGSDNQAQRLGSQSESTATYWPHPIQVPNGFLTQQLAATWAEQRIHSMETRHRPLLSPGLMRQLRGDYFTFRLYYIKMQQSSTGHCLSLPSPGLSTTSHHLHSQLSSPPLFLVRLTDQDEESGVVLKVLEGLKAQPWLSRSS